MTTSNTKSDFYTRLTFSFARAIEETTQFAFAPDGTLPNASGNFQTAVRFIVEHELKRDILLVSEVGYIKADFIGIPRVDDRYEVGVQGRYLVNRNVTAIAAIGYASRSSNVVGAPFDRAIASVALKFDF